MRFFACCGVAWAMLLGSCALNPLTPWEGPTLSESREQLTLEQLQSLQMPPLLDMSFMARPAWATPAREDFTGSLSFQEAPMTYLNAADAYAGENVFPAFQARFVSHQGTLIPLSQGLLRTMPDGSLWDVMLGTGKVWHEAGDGDWNRASFPLSLTDRFIGQVRNCVASFVYQSEQMSNVYVQCSQETADANDGRLGNLQGMLSADYVPGVSGEASALIASSLQARQERLPVQPLSVIDAQGEIAAYFNQSFLTSASTSAGAVMVEGQVYLHPPQTRHGLYPYPGEMRHGLYSVTKSMAGALALFYFAERYGDAIFDARITDYVPALRNHSGWQDVTFSHALNMVTGTEGGEDAEHLLNTIIVADTASESIANVAKLGDEPAEPGQQFNYASTHFFVLSYALQNYVEAREGKGVKYWDLLRENVLIPIGAAHFTVQHTQEDDGTLGIPFLAYGVSSHLY